MSDKISRVIFMGRQLLPHIKEKEMQNLLKSIIDKLAIVHEANNAEINSAIEQDMKEPIQVIENLYKKYATN